MVEEKVQYNYQLALLHLLLVNDLNVDLTRLQATIYPSNYTMEQIVVSTKDCNIIKVLDEGKIVGQYTGYTQPLAYTMNYIDSETPVISIELGNADVITQLNSLNEQISAQAETINALSTVVSDVDDAVAMLASVIGGENND